jgi:hypothetical protein
MIDNSRSALVSSIGVDVNPTRRLYLLTPTHGCPYASTRSLILNSSFQRCQLNLQDHSRVEGDIFSFGVDTNLFNYGKRLSTGR